MGNYSELVETQKIDFFCSLNERDRRWYAAIEAVKLGHGGIQYISLILGCHQETVVHGITELNSEERLTTDRIRKKGGGGDVVSKVLYEQGFRRRKPQKKRTMGQNKDRDAQFRNLKKLKQEYLDAGKPVLSMDTKKRPKPYTAQHL